MLDINLLAKDVRVKKQKEIERIKTSTPQQFDTTLGKKNIKKTPTVNFFKRFFSKPVDHAVKQEITEKQSILLTPKPTLPDAPPDVAPYPLKPVAVPSNIKERVAAILEVKQPPEPKLEPIKIAKSKTGEIILPDIAHIATKQIVLPSVLKPLPKKLEIPVHETPKVAPPPPAITKNKMEINVQPRIKSPIAIGNQSNDNKALINKKINIEVMPRKIVSQEPISLLNLSIAGVLSLIFIISFIFGSFFVFNRWVLALESVKNTYANNTDVITKNIQNVAIYTQESATLANKTQILYDVFQKQELGDNKINSLTQKINSLTPSIISNPAISIFQNLVTVSGILISDKQTDDLANIITTSTELNIDQIIYKTTNNGTAFVQFTIK